MMEDMKNVPQRHKNHKETDIALKLNLDGSGTDGDLHGNRIFRSYAERLCPPRIF